MKALELLKVKRLEKLILVLHYTYRIRERNTMSNLLIMYTFIFKFVCVYVRERIKMVAELRFVYVRGSSARSERKLVSWKTLSLWEAN